MLKGVAIPIIERGQEYLSVAEASRKLRCHRETVARLVRAGKLPGAFKLGKVWAVPSQELEAVWRPHAKRPVGAADKGCG